jgi:hypothetical protein
MPLRRPSLATVLASLALFVALGGVSVAQEAVSSAAGKISGSSIKDRSIKARQIARSAITSAEIKNGAIGAADLDAPLTAKLATTGAPGPAGPAGATGATGPAGPAGPTVVPANGVDASTVKDASLAARDVGRVATSVLLDFAVRRRGSVRDGDLDVAPGPYVRHRRAGPERRRDRGDTSGIVPHRLALRVRPARPWGLHQPGQRHDLQPDRPTGRRSPAPVPGGDVRRQRLNAGIRGASHRTGAATIAVAPMASAATPIESSA